MFHIINTNVCIRACLEGVSLSCVYSEQVHWNLLLKVCYSKTDKITIMALQGSYYYIFLVIATSMSMHQAGALLSSEEKETLLNEHNSLRSKVNPPAVNME